MNRNGWRIVLVAIVACLGACKRAPDEPPQARQPGALEREAPKARIIRKIREPAVAGMFYPEDKEELAQQIDRYLADVKPEPVKNLRGLIAPHAGYQYSGPVAAVAYKQLAGRAVDTVIVMAPSHRAAFEGASIPDVDAYQTPLGLVPLSLLTEQVVKVPPFVRNPRCYVPGPGGVLTSSEDTPDTREHSLEVQLPFLQRT